jgi:hypothetical protein
MVVNASYPAHLLVGMTWPGRANVRQANQFALRAWPRRFISWVTAFSRFLWHAAGLFVLYESWIDDRPTWVRLSPCPSSCW